MAVTRRRFLYGTTVLGAAATVGCSSRVGGSPRPDPEATRAAEASAPESPRLVTIGILNYQPYTIEQGGEITGPVPEVARAVLGQLGVTDIKIQLMRDEQVLAPALAAGQLDMVGGLAVRKDLCDTLSFSVPDYVSGTAFIVPSGNPKGLSTYADVQAKGAKVAVMAQLPEQADAASAGLAAASIVPLPEPTAMMDAVRSGQADCAAFDDLSARELVKSSGGALATAKPFAPPNRLPLVGAYGFPKESADLLDSFNNRLRDLHESGDWLAIVAPFGLTEDHVPPPDLTTERACAG
ncbi:MAG TPA: transporter substrate-binding domain-containing protein [Actinophytocola sp.]|jgi:polar amino acid transport system substrate-binding protein|uniref:transporter substrate-binding domain-containing protein n=1 Tax=Actinophytocola sp. TaxID=1872138 RepID=UPI002F92838D